MLDEPSWKAKLATCSSRSINRKCFRVVDLEVYLNAKTRALLFDLGPKISKIGQRFSPPDDHRGLYVSTELVTAGAEYANGQSAWKKGECGKHVTFDMKVKLLSVLDLTDAATRRLLKTSKKEIQSAWEGFVELNSGAWPPTWTLGHEAFVSGRFDGILFPSTKSPAGTCLLIFTERLVTGRTSVTILKQDGSIWERHP
jgi:RES domain-containing protein